MGVWGGVHAGELPPPKMLIPRSRRAGAGLKRAEGEVGEPFAVAHAVSRRLLPSGAAEGSRGVGSGGLISPWTLSQAQNPLRSISPGCRLHRVLTEHFPAPAVPGVTVPFWAGLNTTSWDWGGKIRGGGG